MGKEKGRLKSLSSIQPSVAAVERREFAQAQALFEDMVQRLRALYGPSKR